MKIQNTKAKPWEIALAVALILALTVGIFQSSANSNLSEKLIRLHVVGASDSAEDQALKLLVRDETLALLEPRLAGVTEPADARQIICENIPVLEETLRAFVAAQGFDQTVTVTLEREAFPTRAYSTFSLPAGPYTALRVVLDQGEGQNWWCVVFPPLCASAAISKLPETSKAAGLTDGDVKLITQADEGYTFRFKIAEWFGGIRNWFCR